MRAATSRPSRRASGHRLARDRGRRRPRAWRRANGIRPPRAVSRSARSRRLPRAGRPSDRSPETTARRTSLPGGPSPIQGVSAQQDASHSLERLEQRPEPLLAPRDPLLGPFQPHDLIRVRVAGLHRHHQRGEPLGQLAVEVLAGGEDAVAERGRDPEGLQPADLVGLVLGQVVPEPLADDPGLPSALLEGLEDVDLARARIAAKVDLPVQAQDLEPGSGRGPPASGSGPAGRSPRPPPGCPGSGSYPRGRPARGRPHPARTISTERKLQSTSRMTSVWLASPALR